MNQNQLKPAGSFAANYGVKCIAYGPPGTGKTPMVNSAPRPVLLALEPGLRSMTGSQVPTWFARTVEQIDEFFEWLFKSKESTNYDTVAVDSVSHMAEMYLKHHLLKNKDGRKVYGEMSRSVMEHLDGLFNMERKHAYLIAKEDKVETVVVTMQGNVPVTNSTYKKRPYFPGNDLNIKVPHLYDGIFHIDRVFVPGMSGEQVAVRTVGTTEVLARDRSGKLAQFEPPNLANVFAKAMQS